MENVLAENRQKGWIELPASAPLWVRTFITEFRTANLEKRKMNATYLASFSRGAEVRSAASATFERTQRRVPNPHALTEQQLAEARGRLEDKRLREKAEAQGRQIRVQQIRAEMGLV